MQNKVDHIERTPDQHK